MTSRHVLAFTLVTLMGTLTLPAHSRAPASAHGAQASTPAQRWVGTYVGELRCADCEGIRVEVQLQANHRYLVRETYLGKRSAPRVSRGQFRFDEQTPNLIVLRTHDGGSLAFRVRDHALELRAYRTHESLGDDPRYLFPQQTPR